MDQDWIKTRIKTIMIATRWAWRLIFILGVLSLLAGITASYLKIDVSFKHSNIASNPVWVDPPMTDWDKFILQFPSGWFFVIAIVLLTAMFLRALLIVTAKHGRQKSG